MNNNLITNYQMQTGKHYDIIKKNIFEGKEINPVEKCKVRNIPWIMYESPQYFAISSAITCAYQELHSF